MATIRLEKSNSRFDRTDHWLNFSRSLIHLGLPFSAFVEAFFLLSQRKFPNASSLLDSVNRLVQHSTRHLNSAISNSSGTTIPQSNATIVMRSARNSTSASTRQNSSIRRSPTMVSTQRNSTSPTLIQRNRLLSLNQSASSSQKSKAKESTRSVFPLFFDVLWNSMEFAFFIPMNINSLIFIEHWIETNKQTNKQRTSMDRRLQFANKPVKQRQKLLSIIE